MSDEMFTEKDAENDGLIKEQVGPKMAGNAKRRGGELWEMFQQVCEHQGVQPKMLLGDGLIKALNDEDFAQRIAAEQVDMTQVQQGQLRIEDAKFVQELRDQLDLGSDDDDFGWLNDVVKQRIKSKTESPIPRFETDRDPQEQQQVERRLKEIEENVNNMAKALSGEGEIEEVDDEESVDDLFGGGSDEGEEMTEEETESDAEVEINVGESEGELESAINEVGDEGDGEGEEDGDDANEVVDDFFDEIDKGNDEDYDDE